MPIHPYIMFGKKRFLFWLRFGVKWDTRWEKWDTLWRKKNFIDKMFLPESPNNGQWLVAIQSVTYPTRLETWTKESNMCASHWEAVNLRGKCK